MGEIQENSSLESFRYRVGIMQEWFKYYNNQNRYKDSIYFDINIFTPSWCYESDNEFVSVKLEELAPKRSKKLSVPFRIEEDIKNYLLMI